MSLKTTTKSTQHISLKHEKTQTIHSE